MWTGFTFTDALGILGSVAICGAYLAVSLRRLDPAGLIYHGVNAAGAGLLLVSLWSRPNPGAILIEFAWLAIALFAIARALARR